MVEKTFPADDAYLTSALEFTEEELDNLGSPLKSVMQITVCVEEMFVNVAHYAYEGKNGDVTLVIDGNGGAISITLIDSGIPFDPLARPDPDVTLSAEERKIGGLGIYMVKQTMDKVHYERKDGKNIFTMIKNI